MPIIRPVPILILAGQSNANNSDIIRASFDRVQAVGGLMVHLAVNGSPLSSSLDRGGGDWSAGTAPGEGELFRALIQQLDSILNPASATYVPGAYLESMIWLHGGADIFSTAAANRYGANLAAVNDALTARFGAHDLVISGMANASLNNRDMTEGQTKNWLAVQAAQVALAAGNPRIHLIDPDQVANNAGLSAAQMLQSDYIHYSSTTGFAGHLGKALALAAMPTSDTSANVAMSYVMGTSKNNDLTIAGSGTMQVWAGKGTDCVTLGDRINGVIVVDGGSANARIIGAEGGPKLFVDLIAVESLRLTAAGDDVYLGGSITSIATQAGNDKVIGSMAAESIWLGNGNDTAFGEGGADRLSGGFGNDSLSGGDGNDTLFGGSGMDRLTGGAGLDTFTGGPGADVFVFARNTVPVERDVITDFTNGSDTLNMPSRTWADITVTAHGANTLITTTDASVFLLNVRAFQIDAGDFIFT